MEKRIWGVLVGTAVGDAMGMPTECWSQSKINRIFPNGVEKLYPADKEDSFGRDFEAGRITDDTINMLMLLDMLKKNQGKVCVEDYVSQLMEWNNHSGVSAYVSGPSTLKALEKISKGVPIEQTGIMGTTNGAAMKIAPIGIVSDYKNMEQLVQNVYQICLPTHNTKIAVAGASAVAAAVSYAVRGGNSIEEIWKIAYQAIETADEYGYDFPAASLRFRMEQARNIVVQENGNETAILKRLYEEIGSGMETIETIPCVFAIIEMANGNPWKAAQISARIGWDTDTIGAISSAICGGIHPDFPEEIVQTIQKVNEIDFKTLTEEIMKYYKE